MLWLMLFLILGIRPTQGAIELCEDVKVRDLEEFDLSDSEELLLCGDKKSGPYKYIPLYQKQIYLKSYLQSRAYLNPLFEITGDELIVTAGKTSEVKKISIQSLDETHNEIVKKRIRRLFKSSPLVPKTLDAIESDAKDLFRRFGYPCIKPSSTALIDESRVIIHLDHLKKYKFGEVSRQKIDGLYEEALDRFYPFTSEQYFNSRLINLTEKRMVRSEIVAATYFTDTCLDDEVDFSLSQFFITSPPRTIRFGIGASTEVGPMLRFKWSNHRYKEMASKLEASLNLSFRNQSLSLRSDQFLWRDHSRRSLYSELSLGRESQKIFEQRFLNFDNQLRWTKDSDSKLFTWGIGPSYEYGLYSTDQDIDTKTYSALYLKSSFSFVDHDFEFYDINPEEGNAFSIDLDYRDDALGFSTDLLRLSSSYTHFHRFTYWGKGSLIGGFKSILGTSIVERKISLNTLPPTVKFYAGGSDDIRGFDLKSLPTNNGVGALTKVGAKFELRRTYFFIPSLEAFSFYDVAFLGDKSFNLDESYWSSLGLGLRWLSPIGLVQTFIANSYRFVPYKNLGPYAFIGLGGSF